MRVAIISYSFSGNTKRACLFLMKTIKDRNIDAVSFDLKPENEEKGFLKQCKSAFYRQRVNIQKTAPDIGSFDFIIFSSPVWAFTFAPALRVYLESIKDFNR